MTTPDTTAESSVATREVAEAPTSWADELDFDQSTDAMPRRGRRWRRWLIVPLVLIVLVAAALWVINPFATNAVALVTAPATSGTIVSSVSLSGAAARRIHASSESRCM